MEGIERCEYVNIYVDDSLSKVPDEDSFYQDIQGFVQADFHGDVCDLLFHRGYWIEDNDGDAVVEYDLVILSELSVDDLNRIIRGLQTFRDNFVLLLEEEKNGKSIAQNQNQTNQGV